MAEQDYSRWAAFGGGPPAKKQVEDPPAAAGFNPTFSDAPSQQMSNSMDFAPSQGMQEDKSFAPGMGKSMLQQASNRFGQNFRGSAPRQGFAESAPQYGEAPSMNAPDSSWADQLRRFKSQDTPAYQPPSGGEEFQTRRSMREHYGRPESSYPNMGGQAPPMEEMPPAQDSGQGFWNDLRGRSRSMQDQPLPQSWKTSMAGYQQDRGIGKNWGQSSPQQAPQAQYQERQPQEMQGYRGQAPQQPASRRQAQGFRQQRPMPQRRSQPQYGRGQQSSGGF